MIPPMTQAQVEAFVEILENPEASEAGKQLAQNLIKTYFEKGAGAAGKELMRIRAHDDLEAFSQYVFGYENQIHHKLIYKFLGNNKHKRLCIVAPPESSKSEMVAMITTTFLLGRDPDHRTILLQESDGQVEKITSQIRPILRGANEVGERFKEVFPKATPNEDEGFSRSRLYLGNRTRPIKDPCLLALGIGSNAIQGARADAIILDDVISPNKIRSETEMKKVKDDLRDLIIPRLVSEGRCVAIMTRWGENDLLKTFLTDLNFALLYLPALELEDPRGAFVDYIPSKNFLRPPREGSKEKQSQWVRHEDPEVWVDEQMQEAIQMADEFGLESEVTISRTNMKLPCVRIFLHADCDPVLWPERTSLDALLEKREPDPVSFRLVYNGDVSGVKGDVFQRQWFQRYGINSTITRVPQDARWYASVDPAVGGSKNNRGDYFVIAIMAVDKQGNKYLVDIFRKKILTTEQPQAIKDALELYPQLMAILIEATNYQASLFHGLAQESLPVLPITPIKKKELKIESSAVYYKQGKVFLPENPISRLSGESWISDFIDEATLYPRGKHDDQLDAVANLLEWLSLNSGETEEYEVGFG